MTGVRAKWKGGIMTVIQRPLTPSEMARLRSWLPHLLLIFILLSLFLAHQWWQTTRQELTTKETELADTRQELVDTHQELTIKETELADTRQELADTRQELAEALMVHDLPQPRITKGRQLDEEKHQITLLRGRRVNHTFPRRSFYESSGIYTLNSGSWSLNASAIGGPENTGSSTVSLRWDAAPKSCIEQPNGFWEDAFRVNCRVRLEWTIESRYPYTTLQFMPIENLILPPTRP